MKTPVSRLRSSGFSLIEVLIAVVILSFGLLALAALQTRMIQSSAESKAQSVALALAKDKLEDMRSFTSLAGYAALNSGSDPANDPALTDAGGSLGGVDFDRSWTVKRYALATGATTFTQLPAGNNTGTLPSAYIQNNEFKTIDVRVTWTDSAGQARSVAMEDAIAGLDPQDTARTQRKRGGRPRGPEVVIVDPSTEAGVIPIAVGQGSETAATNPKPVNVSRTGDDAVETRFDVLTYSALSGGTALAQSRVETSVVGCTCTNATTTAAVYRPTYWNGFRYVPPQVAAYNAPARAKSGVTQSTYCDTCCKTHHDPGGTTGPKFSPRRSVHDHYNRVAGVLTLAVANGDYLEACRLIRVDGIFDVAADLSNDYFNLLATSSNASNPAPSSVGVANYQGFVLDYLNRRYVSPSPGAGSESAVYNNRTNPPPSSDATTHNLDDPTEIGIQASNDTKWLHSRGLYVDFLEQEALDAIGDAETGCPGTSGSPPTATQLRDCVLRILPFTSINLTEISNWTPITGREVKVTNDDFSTSEAIATPIRGKVTPGTNPTPNQVTNVNTDVTASNSGVAIFGDIDPDDVASTLTDAQPFRIGGNSGGTPGGTFNVVFNGYSIAPSDPPQAGYDYLSRSDVCSATAGGNPFACATQQGEPLPLAMTVRVGNYNKSGTDSVASACWNNHSHNMPYRVVFDVTSMASSNGGATLGSLVVNNNNLTGTIPTGEYTEVLVTPVTDGDVITATLSGPTYLCPENYPGSGVGGPNCSGNGGNSVSTWSSTFVNCPSQAAPPDFP